MMLEPAIKKTTEVLEQLAFLPCGFHRHHSICISQRFIRKLCSEESRCKTAKCWDTLVNSAPAALCFDCLLMKSRCFVLSLSLFFFALSVLILSPWSTQKPHGAFSKFYKWWCFFHYHRGPVLRGRIWTSVTARGDEKCGYGQEKRLRKKGMTSWPHVSSIHSFHIQPASQTAFSDCRLWGLSETALFLPQMPLSPKHEVPSPQSWTWMPALLPSTGDVETPSELLVETKIKMKNDLQAWTKLLPHNFWWDAARGSLLVR